MMIFHMVKYIIIPEINYYLLATEGTDDAYALCKKLGKFKAT